MNLVDLIVTACLIAQPSVCSDRHLLFQSEGSLRACMFKSQQYLAQWAGEHPDLKIVRWHCEWPSQEKQQI